MHKHRAAENDLAEAELHFVDKLCAEFENKLCYAKWVDKKKKSRKTSRCILVVATYMLFLVKRVRGKNSANPLAKKKLKFPGELRLKLQKQFHLIELRSISVFKNNKKQMELQFLKSSPLQFITPFINEMIRSIRSSIRLFTCGFPKDRLPGLFGVNEEELLPLERFESEDFGPANGFLHTYSAFCCFYKQPIAKEVMRYVTDLHEAGVVEFCLHDCPGVDAKGEPFNIEPIAAALRYNTYFKSLWAANINRRDILQHLCHIFRFNTSITKIVFSQLQDGNIGDLGDALHYNKNNAVQIIDLSGTHVTKGCTVFCFCLQNFTHSLKVLNLSSCSLDGKQIGSICEALSANYGASLTIEELDLSNNRFDEHASSMFETWLSKAAEYSRIQVLRLGSTNQSFASMAAYFHFLSNLRELDISHSKLDQRAVQLLCSLADKSATLHKLNLSHCNLTGRYAASITEAFISNKRLSNTVLNLSSNEMTETDAEFLAKALSLNYNCHTFNIARNKFKETGLIGILQSIVLSASSTLDTIVLDHIYKPTYVGERVSSALMSVTNSLACVKSISLAGGFGSVAIPFINYLQTNRTLLELDVSGNQIGDSVASAIAEMLRKNQTLLRIKCDGNNISPSGWKMILASFMHNHTVVEMDFPWNDYAKYASLSMDKLEELRAVLIDIQRALQTNHTEDKMNRLKHPPPQAPPTYVQPLAVLPGKLTPSSATGLSSLAAQKISVDRDTDSRHNSFDQSSSQRNSFDQTSKEVDYDYYDTATSTSTNEFVVQAQNTRRDRPDLLSTNSEEWSSESVSSESEDTPRRNSSRPPSSNPATAQTITLANLNQPRTTDEKAERSADGEDDSVMSSDSGFDF